MSLFYPLGTARGVNGPRFRPVLCARASDTVSDVVYHLVWSFLWCPACQTVLEFLLELPMNFCNVFQILLRSVAGDV